MNVLPLVTAFILLFAMGTYTLIHKLRGKTEESTHYAGGMRIHHENGMKYQEEIFKLLDGKEIQKEKQPRNEETQQSNRPVEYCSLRERENPLLQSKLNITFLLNEENAQLKQIAATLIRLLYEHAPFYRQGMENEVLNQVITVLTEYPAIEDFEELFIQCPNLYQLIKGTHKYRLHTSDGYPPLEDFISLDRSETMKKPIHFTFASRILLEAVFDDPRLVGEIYLGEKERWEEDHKHHQCTKQELEQLLAKRQKSLTDYDSLFFFTTERKGTDKYLIYDQASSVQVKIEK